METAAGFVVVGVVAKSMGRVRAAMAVWAAAATVEFLAALAGEC